MTDNQERNKKKLTKAQAKIAKAEAKGKVKMARAEENARIAEVKTEADSRSSGFGHLPKGVGIAIQRKNDSSELVVSGLTDDQLKRILPQINKEVLITITKDTNALRAQMMQFVREGLFQTIIKIVAGLIVGYLLFKFGLIGP
jgi:predicted metal-dependent peptidase